MIRKSIQEAITADRMSVSLDRFLLIEPVKIDHGRKKLAQVFI